MKAKHCSSNRRPQGMILNNNKNFYDSFDFDSMSGSSDEEVQRKFWDDFISIYQGLGRTVQQSVAKQAESDVWFSNEYEYPKLVWDQTPALVMLDIKLQNVKEFEICYKETGLSFRYFVWSFLNLKKKVELFFLQDWVKRNKIRIWFRFICSNNRIRMCSYTESWCIKSCFKKKKLKEFGQDY